MTVGSTLTVVKIISYFKKNIYHETKGYESLSDERHHLTRAKESTDSHPHILKIPKVFQWYLGMCKSPKSLPQRIKLRTWLLWNLGLAQAHTQGAFHLCFQHMWKPLLHLQSHSTLSPTAPLFVRGAAPSWAAWIFAYCQWDSDFIYKEMKKLFFFSPEAHFSSVHGSVGTSPATKAEVNMARCPWEPCFSHPILFDSLDQWLGIKFILTKEKNSILQDSL